MSAHLIPLVGVIAGIAFACVQVLFHAAIIRRGRMNAIVKKAWTAGRGLAMATAAVIGSWHHPPLIPQIFFSLPVCAFVFAAAFPPLLNIAMRWHPFYLGSTAQTDVRLLATWLQTDERDVRRTHQSLYQNNHDYRASIHLCGAITDLIAVLAAAACYAIAVSLYTT